MFPGSLLPPNFPDPDNPDHLIGRSEVERRREYIQQLHVQLPEQHPLVQLVHQCLHNTPARRPSAEELLQQLEAVRDQIEGGPYGQLVSVNMEKLRMVRTLREKDTEIGQLQQQMQQLEVEVEAKDNQLQQQSTQLRERNNQIDRQQREQGVLRVRNARQRKALCCSCDVTSHVRMTREGYRWRWKRRTLNCSDRKQNSKKRPCSSADYRESYKH